VILTRFTREEVHSKSNIKSSVQRSLKTKLVSQFPALEATIDEIIPKKGQLTQVKCEDRISVYTLDSKPLFSQHFDDDLVPSLRLLHTLPNDSIPAVRVDRGAIKFILGGANIMCPGLTSKGAVLPDSPGYEKGQVVAIYAEGKEHALAVGVLTMSTEEIKSINKGIGVEVIQYLGDGLWHMKEL
jgi:malignant T-cell-amplified sequence